ncbi:hypothetical protein [Loigolactobacillus coryniformis]|nr:hypothetical protein [Loigolactobacillus coryniformis]
MMNKLGRKIVTLAAAVLMGGSVATFSTVGAAKAATDDNQVVLKQLDTAPHGKQAFAVTTVAMKGDKIVAAYIDEFQFVKKGTKGMTPVPNSTKGFAKGVKNKQMLISKATNDEAYSGLMKKEAKSTQGRLQSLDAIEKYTVGKTAAQLNTALAKNKKMQKKVISGATLADTNGYVKSIAQTATKGYATKGIDVTDDNITLKQVEAAPHGTDSFAVTTVAMSGDKVAAASIDEFQFVAKKGFKGVPNSNSDFGKAYPKGKVLISKQVNDKAYSALMKKIGKAKQDRMTSVNAITKYASGKTADQLKNDLNAHSKMTDVVSGATLEDTNGYVQSIVDAINK